MKKVINGRRYDTETANELAKWHNMQDVRNFSHCKETLYRKTTGEYFLYGEGGPSSKYSRTVGTNSWSGGERIMPLSLEEAQKWAEEHLEGDEYEEIFGAIEETANKKTVSFSLSEATVEKIARMAAEQSCSKSEVIERLIAAR